jgi:hypothetical protein
MSNTPETDANQIFLGFNPDEGDYFVPAEIARKLEQQRNEICSQRDAAFERCNEAVELYNAAVIGANLIDKDLKKAKRDLKKAESERDKLEKGLKDLINYANTFKPLFNRYQKRQTADTKRDNNE